MYLTIFSPIFQSNTVSVRFIGGAVHNHIPQMKQIITKVCIEYTSRLSGVELTTFFLPVIGNDCINFRNIGYITPPRV